MFKAPSAEPDFTDENLRAHIKPVWHTLVKGQHKEKMGGLNSAPPRAKHSKRLWKHVSKIRPRNSGDLFSFSGYWCKTAVKCQVRTPSVRPFRFTVYLPLCCNWCCQWTLKLIETDLSLISEAAGFLKVEDRLVRSLLPHLFPLLFSPAACRCLALPAGCGGWRWGTAWRMATVARVTSDSANLMCCHGEPCAPPPLHLPYSLPSYLPQKKLCVLMVFWCKLWRGKMVFPLPLPASPSATGAAPPPAACLSQRAVKLAREEALASANYVLIIGNVLANQGLELCGEEECACRGERWIERKRWREGEGNQRRPS